MPDTFEQALARLSPEDQSRVMATLQAGAAMQALVADPDAAKAILPIADKVAKKKDPAHQTLEDRAAPLVDRVMADVDKRFADLRKENEENREKGKIDAAVAQAISEGFTEDGLKGVLEIMKRGVANFDDAKKVYLAEHPAPSPSLPSDRMDWNVYNEIAAGDEKGFFFPEGAPSITEDPEKWERAMSLRYLRGDVALPA